MVGQPQGAEVVEVVVVVLAGFFRFLFPSEDFFVGRFFFIGHLDLVGRAGRVGLSVV